MKLLSVVGTRPEFVLLSPLDETLCQTEHEHVIVHTGQHYDFEMSKVFFQQLNLPEPNYHLGISTGSHGQQTGKIISELEEVLLKEKPDVVLVYGDTNTTLAGVITAVKLHIPVAHIESGYRSFDLGMPEEINRMVADSVSQILFAFTPNCVENLLKEGVQKKRIVFCGNLKAEALLKNIKKTDASDILEKLKLTPGNYALLTCHRQENSNNFRFKRILEGISKSPVEIVFPAHPRTAKLIKNLDLDLAKFPLKVVSPLPYLDFLKLQKEAAFVITDSGGVQVEAFVLKKPCITLRYNTEHIETLKDSANVLAGTEPEIICKEIKKAFKRSEKIQGIKLPKKWDKKVSQRIVKGLEQKLEMAKRLVLPAENFTFKRR